MLSLNFITNNKEDIIQKLMVKNFDAKSIVEEVVKVNEERKQLKTSQDNAKAEMKKLSKQIGQLFKDGKTEKAHQTKQKTAQLKNEIKLHEKNLNKKEEKLKELLVQVPNIPHESVPAGKSAKDNELIRSGGNARAMENNALPHWELASKYNLIDFELGNKITGAGFPVYKGKCAKLQRALISFFLDEAAKSGYDEVLPPILVNEDSGFGTGQLPDKEGQMYHVVDDNLYLIPTAEVPLTNIYRDALLKEEEFPVKITAYTPCFRREAGSYGKDVRGLNRLHQFDKVEIVQIVHPDQSYQVLEQMVSHVESLVQKLNLPYRILKLCGGDMSFTSALTYDFEVYSAAQDKWLEVSSVSNFESYQANRLKLRYKDSADKKNKPTHTLNGSALALPRIVAALLENNQTASGINIPEALIDYCKFDKID
jgi:seryl-tRNA synthetase